MVHADGGKGNNIRMVYLAIIVDVLIVLPLLLLHGLKLYDGFITDGAMFVTEDVVQEKVAIEDTVEKVIGITILVLVVFIAENYDVYF